MRIVGEKKLSTHTSAPPRLCERIIYLLAICALLAGCQVNITQQPVPDGYGLVYISLDDSNARAVYPGEDNISWIDLTFTSTIPGDTKTIPIYDISEPITIKAGTYEISGTVYMSTGTGQPGYKIIKEDITINAGPGNSITLNLEVFTAIHPDNGSGTFQWEITLPDGLSSAMMFVRVAGSDTAVQTVDLRSGGNASDFTTLPSDYYSVQIVLEKPNFRQAPYFEAVHIYPNLTTVLKETFDDSYFTAAAVIRTVNYNYNGGILSGATIPQSVIDGQLASDPGNPTKDGFFFGGWYTDNNTFQNRWNFNNRVYRDITLYAKWQLERALKPVFDPGDFRPELAVGGSVLADNQMITVFKDSTVQLQVINQSDYNSGADITWNYNGAAATGFTYTINTDKTGTRILEVEGTATNGNWYSTSIWIKIISEPAQGDTKTGYAGIEMVWIPSIIGWNVNDDYNAIVGTATLTGFYMGIYEITQQQYQTVMGSNPSQYQGSTYPPDSGETQNRRPVERVSWYNAIEFCNELSVREGLSPVYAIDKTNQDPNNTGSLDTLKWTVTVNPGSNGYRLPTEVQWQYAAQSGSSEVYTINTNSAFYNAWYTVNSNSKTHEVGKLLPNSWGLYDMLGNVAEWCWDWYESNTYPYPNNTIDPTGVSSGGERVARGGNNIGGANTNSWARSYNNRPSFGSGNFGFRVVRPAE